MCWCSPLKLHVPIKCGATVQPAVSGFCEDSDGVSSWILHSVHSPSQSSGAASAVWPFKWILCISTSKEGKAEPMLPMFGPNEGLTISQPLLLHLQPMIRGVCPTPL